MSLTEIPIVTPSFPKQYISESGNVRGVLTFSRTGSTVAPLNFSFSSFGNGIFYQAINTSPTFSAGASTYTVEIIPINDGISSGTKYVSPSLDRSENYVIHVAPPSNSIYILDDDRPINDDFVNRTAINGTSATIAANNYGATRQPGEPIHTTLRSTRTSVWWKWTPPADTYVNVTVTVTGHRRDCYLAAYTGVSLTQLTQIASGKFSSYNDNVGGITFFASQGAEYQIAFDTEDDETQSFTLNFASGAGVGVTATGPYAEERGGRNGEFTFTRTGNNSQPLNVAFTISGTGALGTDYTTPGTSVTIPAGANSVTLPIEPINDSGLENDETVVLTLIPISGLLIGPPASVTIVDEDSSPVVSTGVYVGPTENVGDGYFTIQRSGSQQSPLTVRYRIISNAQVGIDYIDFGTVGTILAGQASLKIPIVPINDEVLEGSEILYIELLVDAGFTLGQKYASVPIEDDEHPVNDAFANAILLSGATDTAAGSILNATIEHGEPFRENSGAKASICGNGRLRPTAVSNSIFQVQIRSTQPRYSQEPN